MAKSADGVATPQSNPDKAFPASTEFYAWYVVLVLCLGNIIAFIDRQIINLLVEPIKADLQISDTQMSLLQGIAFAVFYAFMAVPLGRLADTRNRRALIAAGMALWSVATAACGLARSYLQLFAARMMVGVGEATLIPAAYSILSDYFPKGKLARAISVLTGASFLGSGIALLVGSFIIEWAEGLGEIVLPLVGSLQPWQMAFIIAALPGLFLSALMITVREPPRRDMGNEPAEAASSSAGASTLRDMARFVGDNWRALAPVYVGFPMLAVVQFGLSAWIPAFFIRTYGWTAIEIGQIYGLMLMTLATAGVIVGGWVCDWMLARGRYGANLLTALLSSILAIPFVIAFPLAGDATWSLVLLGPLVFLGAMPFGAGTAAIPMIVPNRMRAQMVALYLLLANLIGLGLGPAFIAVFTDYVLQDPNLIRYSISIVCAVILVVGSSVIVYGMSGFSEKVRNAMTPAKQT